MRRNIFPGVLALVLSIYNVHAQDVQQMFADVNSEYDEQNPVISPDGQTLYFTRGNHPENVGGTRDDGDIWYSTLTFNKTWSVPANARALNNKAWNGVVGFSKDGSTIYLHNHYKEINGIVKSQGLAKAMKKGNGWSSPIDITIPYFKNLSPNSGGYISADESVAVLSMESYGTKGGEDIYVIIKGDNGQWSEPKNLGSTINSPFQEFSPFLSDDTRTLYFSSNGLNGQGSSDVFVAERLDNSWTSWSTPKQLEHVNTKGREKDYRAYKQMALYSSTISSDGYSDLKVFTDQPLDSLLQVSKPLLVTTDSAVFAPIENQKETASLRTIKLHGQVKDAESNEDIDAKLSVARQGLNDVQTTEATKGFYSLHVPDSGLYEIRIDAAGYISERKQLDLKDITVRALELNYFLQPITVGTTVNLKNVLFERATANILKTSFQELDLVVDIMKQNPSMKIRLEGHTDNRGVAKHNRRLSKKRAEAVQDYLIKKGISSRRISEKGYGGRKPIADNNDPEQRKLNRRVEFTVIRD